jgi:hypothetical protein
MTEHSTDRPDLAHAQITGGGGHEPDPDATPDDDGASQAPAAGSGVDLKADNLPE